MENEESNVVKQSGIIYGAKQRKERGNGTFIYGISFPIVCIKPFQTSKIVEKVAYMEFLIIGLMH